jgi:hypothetical protein
MFLPFYALDRLVDELSSYGGTAGEPVDVDIAFSQNMSPSQGDVQRGVFQQGILYWVPSRAGDMGAFPLWDVKGA